MTKSKKRYFIVLECDSDEVHSDVVDVLRGYIGEGIKYINISPSTEAVLKLFEDDK